MEVANTPKVAPQEAAIFEGRWFDSLGNSVFVENAAEADALTVTLSKQGFTKTVKLFFDSRWQCWRCGNGYMRELRYEDVPDEGRALQLISWMTKDRRVSTWKRADVGPSCPEAKVPKASASMEKAPAAPALQTSAAPAAKKDEGVSAPPATASKFRESWYEITEEWDEEQKTTGKAKEQEPKWKDVDKTLWTISEAPNYGGYQRNSKRGGRCRTGRGLRT